MAEPARDDAPAPGPTRAEMRKLDPTAPGWAPVRNLLANAAGAAITAIDALAARPDCPDAQRRVEMICDALVNLGDITRLVVIDEAILKDAERRAYARGVADCKAARCSLEVIPGGG